MYKESSNYWAIIFKIKANLYESDQCFWFCEIWILGVCFAFKKKYIAWYLCTVYCWIKKTLQQGAENPTKNNEGFIKDTCEHHDYEAVSDNLLTT